MMEQLSEEYLILYGVILLRQFENDKNLLRYAG